MTICLFALLLLGVLAPVVADPIAIEPQQGVLVLRNGRVLRGNITQAGDRYLVALPGREIRVKAAEVEMTCRDLHEAYGRKRQRIDPRQIEAHLALARWCLQHQLNNEAAAELADAQSISSRHPDIAPIERRLQLALRPSPPPPPVSGPKETRPDRKTLERLARSLPPGTMEQFTNKIQPLLINGCATSACHGPRCQTEFRLSRISPRLSGNQGLTLRNLYATLERVDTENPDESPLLTMPRQAHGTAKGPIFGPSRRQQYERLTAWVREVVRDSTDRRPETLGRPENPLLQVVSPGGLRPDEAAPSRSPRSDDPRPAPSHPATEPPPSRHRGPSDPRGVDPFDPDVFNRRYHRK